MDEELSYRPCGLPADRVRSCSRQTGLTDKDPVANRTNKTPAPAEARPATEPKTAWAAETHSGEGAATALKTLRKMEEHRDSGRPAEPLADNPED
jgi:hypothetical protein